MIFKTLKTLWMDYFSKNIGKYLQIEGVRELYNEK